MCAKLASASLLGEKRARDWVYSPLGHPGGPRLVTALNPSCKDSFSLYGTVYMLQELGSDMFQTILQLAMLSV